MHKKKILIVEDEEIVAHIEKEVLKEEGFEVEIAKDGIEGLQKIKEGGHDVIISDFQMPYMTGEGFYLELKKLSQSLEKRVIFVSGFINDFIESSGNRYLLKPFSNQQLIQIVKDLIQTEAQPKAEK